MREREYSLATTLARVRAAKAILMDCAPCGYEQIATEKWQAILQELADWDDRITSEIHADDCEPHVWWCPDCDQAFIAKDVEACGEDSECPDCSTALKRIPEKGLGV